MEQDKARWEIPLIIPSYEPDEKLLKLLGQLRESGFQNIVLVDDGSGEDYACFFARAERDYGCRVLRHAVNQGKGRALKTALISAFRNSPGWQG